MGNEERVCYGCGNPGGDSSRLCRDCIQDRLSKRTKAGEELHQQAKGAFVDEALLRRNTQLKLVAIALLSLGYLFFFLFSEYGPQLLDRL